MAKKTYALIWNNWYLIDFLAHKLAKYQYVSMRLRLFVKFVFFSSIYS